MSEFRIGYGYDVHRLVVGRRLILGGIDIPHEKGLLGHSDADVLIHAIMDAILGALGKGDIGKHFPDDDDAFLDASSMNLLIRVKKLMDSENAKIVNLDTTLVLQKPKISPYIEKMRENIAFALSVDVSRINVKATTEERLGFTGSEEGAAAHAVVSLAIN
jgi:2-C-methyl-D-erythritol 2,4-cyclodiphosphate synthase